MSDALDYLIKARGDAVLPYFKFLKESGKHLDPRTRDLISVITKVAVQTEKGFKQYLSRALRNGASAHEVLDALLMAFPVLGLAKIVWAVDILLEMDIPEFRPEVLNGTAAWRSIAPVAELPDGEISYRQCDGRNVFIYREGDGFKVYNSRCPHQVTDIPDLALEGERLTCPKHGWVFDIRSGHCVDKGDHPLKAFDTKIEGEVLYAFW